MHHPLPPVYYIVFTAITAVAVVLQVLILLGIWIAVRGSLKKLHRTADELKVKALPAIATAYDLLNDLSPKLKNTAGNLNEVSNTLRTQTGQWNTALNSLLEKTTKQVNRADAMTSAALDAVENVAKALETAVEVPAQRISRMARGVRAGFDVLFGKKPVPATSAEPKPKA